MELPIITNQFMKEEHYEHAPGIKEYHTLHVTIDSHRFFNSQEPFIKSDEFEAFGTKFSLLLYPVEEGPLLFFKAAVQNETDNAVYVLMELDDDNYGHHLEIDATIGPKAWHTMRSLDIVEPVPDQLKFHFTFVKVTSLVSMETVSQMAAEMDDLKSKMLALKKRKSTYYCTIC